MTLRAVNFHDRPDLWSRLPALFAGVWPEYNVHSDVMADGRWDRLHNDFSRYQLVLHDSDTDDVPAAARALPIEWDGDVDTLGPGLDETILASFAAYDRGARPTALCAIGIEVPDRHRGRGLAGHMLVQLRDLARRNGLGHVIVPVRPTWKERYPLTPIERYARWRRDDGEPFDPWIRRHVRSGGRIGPALPRSSRITGTITEWESWTTMAFPDDGVYVFPGGLAPLHIEHARDLGDYWEPNVWVIHSVEEQEIP
jgi:GNAT superfamily N-acetyltransferase